MTEAATMLALAGIAHEANRAYCEAIGDTSQVPWEVAPAWQRQSSLMGVIGALTGNTPEQSHESWMREKLADGWMYGEVKNPEAKQHPCLVAYAELPQAQRVKDHIFIGVVRAAARLAFELTPAA